VLAILFTYAHRGSRAFVPVAVFNALMLLSVPSEGGHYLVDVLGGVTVGGLAILMTRALPARTPALATATTG
jgi:membrane-associated phospholipid phosphatase